MLRARILGSAALSGLFVSLVVSVPSIASAQWYAGAKVATATMDLKVGFDTLPATETDDSADVTWGVFGGYSLSPGLALEAGYDDLGSDYDLRNTLGRSEKIVVDARAVSLTLLGRVKVHERVQMLGRLGIAYWNAELSYTEPGFGSSGSDGDVDPVVGLGFEWSVTDAVGIRFEWQLFQNIGDEVKTNLPPATGARLQLNGSDVSLLAISTLYRF